MTNFKQQGFALLYAVLLTSIVLTVGLGLSSILRKQIILSSTGAASQQAYYAANTIKECVIHWGVNSAGGPDDPFLSAYGFWVKITDESGDSYSYIEEPESDQIEIYCSGQQATVNGPNGTGDDLRTFEFTNFEVAGVCAQATLDFRPAEGSVITATGYNTPCDQIDNPRRVERQIVDQGSL